MRIALLTREYPPETAWGGIGTFYSLFAEGLSALGHEVEVFAQGLRSASAEWRNGVLVHRLVPPQWVIGRRVGGDLAGMPAKNLGVFALSLAIEIFRGLRSRHSRKPFDLIEGHEHLGINALVNVWAPRRLVTVTRYHTAYHTLVSRGLENWPTSRLIARLEGSSMRRARARVAASRFIEGITAEDFPEVPPCDSIIPMFPAGGASVTPSLFEAKEKLIIVVGRLSLVKRVEIAAQAFAAIADRFPEWRLEFAGIDTEISPGVTVWRNCQSVLGSFDGRYKYHGALRGGALDALYRRSRITLLPSAFESFGLVAVEAMAAGSVPVVSDATALPEVVGDAGIVCRKGDLADFVEKLAALLADEERQRRLSRRAVERAAGEFSHTGILSANIAFFRKLLKRQGVLDPSA